MRRTLISTLLSALVCAALVAVAVAQDDQEGEGDTPAVVPPTPAQELSPADLARRAKIVARVGDVTVTLGDVEDSIAQQSPFMRARYRDRAQLDAHVQSLVRFELLARAAERAEIGANAEVVRTVKQTAVQQLIRREFDERLRPDTVPAEQVQEYYDNNPAEFSRPETRRASHIQLATREEAERLVTQARESDARRFRELAREHSADPETALRGGDLRFFDAQGHARNTRDPQVDEAIAAAAFELAEVGDVAGPIAVGERWSVIKLTGRRPAEHRSLEQAEPTIRLRLWRENRQQSMEDFVARLRREANVEVHHDLLRNIRLDPPEGETEEEEEGEQRTPRNATGTRAAEPGAPSSPADRTIRRPPTGAAAMPQPDPVERAPAKGPTPAQ